MSCSSSPAWFRTILVTLAATMAVSTGMAQEPVQPQVAAPGSVRAASPAPELSTDDGLRIGGGDLIEVSVLGVDDLKRSVRVAPTGTISLPLLGEVRVEGLTPPQAEQLIADRLVHDKLVNNPQVSVFVKEYATQGASILGEVAKPGVYPVLGQRRLFDMLSAAGGTTAKAGRVVSIVRRDHPQDPINVEITDDPAKSLASNVVVLPGDTVIVSRAGIVYVVGEVIRPGGFVMDNNERLTVLQAIALAQGTKTTASLKSAKIIRKSPSGAVTEIPIPLNAIMKAKAADQPLEKEDIIFVPTSPGKNAARRGLEAILQTATGVAIYHPY